MMSAEAFFDFSLQVFMVLMCGAIVFIVLSLIKGPQLEDRVVAIDLFSSVVLSSIALYAVYSDSPRYLDAALVLALFAFMGTVIFARFIEKDSEGDKP